MCKALTSQTVHSQERQPYQQQNNKKRREGQVFPSKTNQKGGKMRIFLFSCENATLYTQTNQTSACF
jgi:hypothetical protein